MCGIAGFSNFTMNYKEDAGKWYSILQQMNLLQRHRGPDDENIYLCRHCGLSHVRLSILDLSCGKQPMTKQTDGHRATIVYNGEIYNMPQLRNNLMAEGAFFETNCDTEVILLGYLYHGIDYLQELNGIFSFCIWDETLE